MQGVPRGRRFNKTPPGAIASRLPLNASALLDVLMAIQPSKRDPWGHSVAAMTLYLSLCPRIFLSSPMASANGAASQWLTFFAREVDAMLARAYVEPMQKMNISTLADSIAHDHISDPLVGSTVKASDVDMFEDRTLRMALREHGLSTAPSNVATLRSLLKKSLFASSHESYPS